MLELYPESLCPHLCEIVLGFEPYFEVEVLRSDADDFARTCRLWQLALRARDEAAVALVGEETARRFRQYLASSELQFRTRTVTNYRCVLHRRPSSPVVATTRGVVSIVLRRPYGRSRRRARVPEG